MPIHDGHVASRLAHFVFVKSLRTCRCPVRCLTATVTALHCCALRCPTCPVCPALRLRRRLLHWRAAAAVPCSVFVFRHQLLDRAGAPSLCLTTAMIVPSPRAVFAAHRIPAPIRPPPVGRCALSLRATFAPVDSCCALVSHDCARFPIDSYECSGSSGRSGRGERVRAVRCSRPLCLLALSSVALVDVHSITRVAVIVCAIIGHTQVR